MTDLTQISIVKYPDPRLHKRSKPVDTFDLHLRELVARMFELMRAEGGVGLAAPQVGINLRLFVMNHSGEPGDDLVVINPVLTPLEGEVTGEEGCLSIPDVRIDVLRADAMKLDAQDLEGKPFSLTASGWETRVWQHETDHLDGILLTDRMGFSDKMRYRKKLKTLTDAFASRKA
jgi:peptide deformylase